MIAAAVEAGLKIATLIDLAVRPRSTVRGSKLGWAAALTLVNSPNIVLTAPGVTGVDADILTDSLPLAPINKEAE